MDIIAEWFSTKIGKCLLSLLLGAFVYDVFGWIMVRILSDKYEWIGWLVIRPTVGVVLIMAIDLMVTISNEECVQPSTIALLVVAEVLSLTEAVFYFVEMWSVDSLEKALFLYFVVVTAISIGCGVLRAKICEALNEKNNTTYTDY
jgi:hypothetical protein